MLPRTDTDTHPPEARARLLGGPNIGFLGVCLSAVLDRPLVIYGDRKQVRDILFADDLVRLYARFLEVASDGVWGRAYNVEGGSEFALSLLEFLDLLAKQIGRRPRVSSEAWRPADQRVYISDTSSVPWALGWSQAHRDLFAPAGRE